MFPDKSICRKRRLIRPNLLKWSKSIMRQRTMPCLLLLPLRRQIQQPTRLSHRNRNHYLLKHPLLQRCPRRNSVCNNSSILCKDQCSDLQCQPLCHKCRSSKYLNCHNSRNRHHNSKHLRNSRLSSLLQRHSNRNNSSLRSDSHPMQRSSSRFWRNDDISCHYLN